MAVQPESAGYWALVPETQGLGGSSAALSSAPGCPSERIPEMPI